MAKNDPLYKSLYCGIPLTEVSRATGISASFLSDIRCGRRRPSMETTIRLAAYLGISISELDSKISGLAGNEPAPSPQGQPERR
jgi:transcriptional regulator with XRE-family HTH domain